MFTYNFAFECMIGELVAQVYDRTKSRPWIWILVLLVLVGGSLWSGSRIRTSEDLFDAFPREKVLDRYRGLQDAAGSSGRVVVGFHGADIPPDQLSAVADRFEQALRESGKELVDSVFHRPDPQVLEDAVHGILNTLPIYADPDRLAAMALLDSSAIDDHMAALRNELASLGAELKEDRIVGDPFGLVTGLLDGLESSAALSGVEVIDGGLFSEDGNMAIVVVFPGAVGKANGPELVMAIDRAITASSENGIEGAAFGAVPMAMANQERIALDAEVTSGVAFVLILLLLIWRYRSVRIPLLFMLPPVLGFIVGLGAIAAMQPRVSALSLGASAALLGIAFDYCFHFFTHLQHRGDIRSTLKEVSAPLLLGCFTTAVAFAALSFVGGRVLADLGTIAAFLLVGAAFTVLFVLPHWVRTPEQTEVEQPISPLPRDRNTKWSLFAILVVTAVLVPFANDVRYDHDPEHLSYIPDAMKEVRNSLEGDSARAVPVLLAATGVDQEDAMHLFENRVDELRNAGDTLLGPVGSAATDLWPSNARIASRSTHWEATFTGAPGERFRRWFKAAAIRNGFVPEAFEPFLQQLGAVGEIQPPEAVEPLAGGIVAEGSEGVTYASRYLLPRSAIAELEEHFKGDDRVDIMHRGLLGERLQSLVQDDLSSILWRTSLIVFLTMLITYGRLELALLTFLPMALGWLWILGVCGLFGISFNMVNILVCTFIFGLGDDYCIFTSEGLLARYGSGKDYTGSFRSAVVLSSVTTILGTGVLLFAEHPALRSIALLSVTGMVILSVISFTVQPALFRLFIGGRAAKGRQPFTITSFLISTFAFCYFLIGCILLFFIWLFLMVLPFPATRKKQWLRNVVRLFTGSLVYVMVNTRKDIRSFRSSIQEQPAIIITNHASFIDILAMLMISPNVVMMTNRWVWNSPFFGRVVRYAGYLRREDGVAVNTERVREAMAQGLSVIIFPEGTRSLDGTIGRFHKGAFHIAEALQAPIIPVILHGFGMAMGKNDALLKNPLLTMRTLPAIQPGDPRFGVTVKERTKSISNWFKAQYKELKTARETPSWFHEQLLRNYMYKGPVLEWHTRVKLRMDRVLHELLHARIPRDARIVDLGSGHGMVTFLLQWSAPDRVVSGFERDPDKVELARHMYSANERTSFETADLENFAPPPADAYILKDVLHYLPLDQQRRLLLACADALEPEGSIYVRDGFDDTGERHRRTTWTERLSTGIGFNRTKGPLQYMTKTMFTEMAMEAGLKLEWSLKEERTSNELVILSKA